MAEGSSATVANANVDSATTTYRWIQLHTGAPGANGTSNVAGNSTRKQATFGSASAGSAATTGALSWPSVSTSEQYTKWSSWSASSGGTFGISGSLTANAVTAGDDFGIASGGLTVSQPVAS